MLEAVNYANISVVALAAVLILIAVRQVGKNSLAIWQIMLLGALVVLFTGQISPAQAFQAINLDVMIFLGAMFVIGESLQESGYLLFLFNRFFRKARNLDQLLLLILFAMGFLSALLMNDTLAIIGTPLMLYFARTLKIASKLLLLTLAFAVTIGSAMSPIGNPQNLLIAVNANLSNPFLVFLQYLLLPTVANLLLAYLLLRLFYKGQFQNRSIQICQEEIADPAFSPSLPHILSSPLRIDPGQDRSSSTWRGRRVSADLHSPHLGAANPSFQQQEIRGRKKHRLVHPDFLCRHVRPDGQRLEVGDLSVPSGRITGRLILHSHYSGFQRPLKPAHLQCAIGCPLPAAAE